MTSNQLNSLVVIDSSRINRSKIPKESHYGYPTEWICPKCGRVYRPFMSEYPYCNKPDHTITCM